MSPSPWASLTRRLLPRPPIAGFFRSHARADWHHWGIMIPRAPEPFRYADVVVTMGAPGFEFFSTRETEIRGPANTAELLVASGAHTAIHERFDVEASCRRVERPEEPVRLEMGDVLELCGDHPRWTAKVEHPTARFALEVSCGEEVTWFARVLGLYQHVGLLAHYEGTVEVDGKVHPVSGPCSFEYAFGRSAARLPGGPRLPVRLFNYEVLSLDDGRQLLAGRIGRSPRSVQLQTAWLKGAGLERRTFTSVTKEILEAIDAVAPDGRVTRVPRRWVCALDGARGDGRLECALTTEPSYGLGRGYVAGYDFSGVLLGEPVSRCGYLEYVDVGR